MICKHCKKEIPENSFVCGYCGVSVDNSTQAGQENKTKTATQNKPVADNFHSAQDVVVKTDDNVRDQAETKATLKCSSDEPAFEDKKINLKEKQMKTADLSGSKEKIHKDTIDNSTKPTKPSESIRFDAVKENEDDYVTPIKSEYYNREIAKEFSGKYKPISTAAFFFTQFLLLIPLLNILLLFVWAFRKRTNANRQAFARSILIWMLLFLIMAIVGLLIMVSFGLTFQDIMVPLK